MSTNSLPTRAEWLKAGEALLTQAGIATARLDALVLLEDALNTNRAHILAHSEERLTAEQHALLKEQLARRCAHEPLAYIRGKTEFYGRSFVVDNRVLEPRPESETMIDLFLQLSKKHHHNVADIGTGSGALGITAALERGLSKVFLHDIDPKTLEVAHKNAVAHNVRAELVKTNLLNNYNAPYDILLCNLPYVPDNFQINRAAGHEPDLALFGGPDGLDLYREMFRQINELPFKPALVFAESMPPQHPELAQIALQSQYSLLVSEDFIQVFAAN